MLLICKLNIIKNECTHSLYVLLLINIFYIMVLEIKGEIDEKSYIDYLMKFNQAGDDLIDLYIDSVGGLVSEGEKIAQHISKNKNNFRSVRNSGDVASIPSTI